MDAPQQRHLKIARVQASDEPQQGFFIQVSLDGKLLHERLTLREPFSPSERAELRWYLEQYASQEPFAPDRARSVAGSITFYSKELYRQLKLDRIFQKDDPLVDENHSLIIDVCEGDIQDHGEGPLLSLQSLHWELLEQLDLWSGFFGKVRVHRLSPERPIDSTPAPTAAPTQTLGTLNVLVVIARNTEINPTAYQDSSPFAALDVLLQIRGVLEQHPDAPRLRVEVVRPGTFDALKRHLGSTTDTHGAGFYHFIHLDMHGRVAKRRLANGDTVSTAWLDFASQGSASRPKPVPADSVAKLLVEHGINSAILNACESARADKGLRANLAMTFLEKGVGSVLAMSYRFPSSVIGSFFSAFYDGLLGQGLPMSVAAAEARRALREHGLRKSRFGRTLQVQDWFIPVLYLSGNDVMLGGHQLESSPTTTAAVNVERAADKRILGRDFDLLRLEEVVTDTNLVLIHGVAGVGKSEFVKQSFDLWRETRYFDKFSRLNMLVFVAMKNITGDKIISRIAKDLELPDSLLAADDQITSTGPLPTWRRAVIALDGIDNIFNNVFNAGLKPVAETLASLFRRVTSSEFANRTGKRITFILTSRRGQDWWEARCPSLLVTPQYFELDGLELSAAINFAESLLPAADSHQNKHISRDTDFLVHIVNLLQRNPLAIKLALPPAARDNPSLEDAFKAIHIGDVHLNYDTLIHTADYALILTLKEVYRRFPEYQDTLCSLADFWIEGPLAIHRYIRALAAYGGLSHVYDMSPVVNALNEVGVWRVSKEDMVEWLHPVFTLFVRQARRAHAYRGAPLWAKGIMKVADFLDSHKRTHPFGSTASLQVEIPRHYVQAVGARGKAEVMADILLGCLGISNCSMPQVMQRMRGSFFNLLTLLDMICRDESVIPLELWPRDFIGMFLSGSRLSLSAPELEMLTRYVQATSEVLLQKLGGFAVPPDFQVFAFQLNLHLFVSTLPGGMTDWDATEQVVARALATIEASEAKYGPMVDENLMWKAMVYRCQAVVLLVQEDEAGADAAWDGMKGIELECFGPAAFQQSSFDSSSTDPGQESTTSPNTMQGPLGGVLFKMRNATASWIPVRHAAWPWLKEQVLHRGNTQALNQLYVPSIETAFENMADAQREAGWTGLEHWTRYYPAQNDLEKYMRRAENPEELMAQLEDGLGRGDWKIAAQAHQLLAQKAAGELKMDVAAFHLEQLNEILRDADPESAVTKRATWALEIMEMVREVAQRGYVDDRDFLRMVEATKEAGIDVKDFFRAQGLPEEAARLFLNGAERANNARRWLTTDMSSGLQSPMESPSDSDWRMSSSDASS